MNIFPNNNYYFQNSKFNSFRYFIIILNDILILSLSLYFAYFLRIEYFLRFEEIIWVNIISVSLYLLFFKYFNISKQFFRHFNYESIYLYFKFYIFFSIIFGLFVFFQTQFFIPRSLVFIFPSFFSSIILINRFLISFFFKFGRVYNDKKVVVIGFNPQIANTIVNYTKVLLFVEDKNEKKYKIF